MGASTIEELNEQIDDMLTESEAKVINYFGIITFMIIGMIIWTLIAIAV